MSVMPFMQRNAQMLGRVGCFALCAIVLLLTGRAASTAETRVLHLASLEWQPYIGSGLPEQGYAAEVVRSACARKGIEVKIDFLPWARALLLARRGEYQGLFPEYFDPSREADFVFSEPFPGGPVGLYKRRFSGVRYATDPKTDLIGALHSLSNYRIGVVRGYLNNPVFDAADYLKKEEAASDAVNLRKLYYGRVDLVFIDRLVAEHLLHNELSEYAGALEMLEPPIEDKPLYIAFSKQAPDTDALRAACDQGLAELRKDGTLDRLRASHGVFTR